MKNNLFGSRNEIKGNENWIDGSKNNVLGDNNVIIGDLDGFDFNWYLIKYLLIFSYIFFVWLLIFYIYMRDITYLWLNKKMIMCIVK